MDENWEDNFNADLFLNEDYALETLRIAADRRIFTEASATEALEQPLYLSTAASTDWDLTGQVEVARAALHMASRGL
eukprot:scaffold4873_cov208-Pinguiococcus_pyrenoidosus.AAC.3